MTDPLRTRVRRAYDQVAADYARVLPRASAEGAADLGMIDHFVDQLGPERHADVLDAGCGTGRMIDALTLADDTLQVTGTDLSAGMLAQARSRHPHVPLLVGELAALPMAADRFDGVLAWYSIIHTAPSGLPVVFAEFARVLLPGGSLLLGFQAGTGERYIARAYGHDLDLPAFLHQVPDVSQALAATGFEVTACLHRKPMVREKHEQAFLLARAVSR